MLSNKLTFSLTSLVMLLIAGLIFAPSVMADGDAKKTHFDLKVTIGAGESMIDVSAEEGLQIATGRDRASRVIHSPGTADTVDPDTLTISLLVEFSHIVNLAEPGARITLEDIDETTANEPKPSGGDFGADDLFAAAYDKEGRALGVLSLAEASAAGTSISQFRDTGGTGRQFLVRIDESQLRNAYIGRGVASGFEIYSLVFFIPKGIPGTADKDLASKDATVTRGIRKFDRAHAIAHFAPDAHQHMNDKSNEFQVDLVDDDQGDAQYAVLTGHSTGQDIAANGLPPNDAPATNRGSGTPGVVSIMRTVDRAGFVESGDFDVRIILTEEPMGGLTADKIVVQNGTVKSVVKGATYKGGHPARTAITDYIPESSSGAGDGIDLPAVPIMNSELGPTMVMYYHAAGNATAAATAIATTAADADTNGTIDNFPEATGRDNKYHSYIATITPNPGVDDYVTVSIGIFDDNVLPVPNRYVPLTAEQRLAATLTDAAMHVRDARVKNESLMVRVNSAGDAKMAAAKAAYDARQKVLDAVANEAVLGNKLIVPAGGYLVIHGADLGDTGIVDPKSKTKDKISAASKLYNVTKLGLPFPADNLDSFFRNGGTLNLAYADIPAATGSGHGDSKEVAAVGHDDDTGYRGATTNAYTTGALIINEIMWGLDGDSKNSQYIELHNPGTAAIGIDNKEWVITVGAPPTGYAVIDSVSNDRASTYWAPPGQGGLTESVRAAQDAAGVTTALAVVAVKDLISMSRMKDATDGTAAASWAASTRPSTNLNGRRIGTPGAANVYVMPAAPPPEPEPTPPPMAAVATAADLMITEIMIASSAGRLPQWIEITNTAVGAVRLDGWVVGIDNDSADADVVASSLSIKLDGVTLDAGQSALVVSKSSNRNSGVAARAKDDGNAGALDSNRIVDASAQVKPASMTYSMLSEMSFRISLEPPLPLAGGVTVRGDVVGNLGGAWELPMSEAGRSSIIRREMGKTTEIMGTDAAGWQLASDTGLGGAYVATYYGDKDDVGTPGYDAGGALPVELSKFSAARDRVTGQVVITWETQSELNNAGFYIKRSQQRTSKFAAVNPTMIPGAGTTSEKQTYTYTDTTAQPNIVYYYQIEDVSLDGNRQTLTRAHRLRGHIGAAGKATTTWGELKSSHQ